MREYALESEYKGISVALLYIKLVIEIAKNWLVSLPLTLYNVSLSKCIKMKFTKMNSQEK